MTLPTTEAGILEVQYQDAGGVWRTFGQAHDLGTLLRTRRFGIGPRQGVTAQHWRVVKTGPVDLTGAVFALDQIAFWRESTTLSPVRLYPFDFDIDTQRYVLACTAGNIEVYNQDLRVASLPTPYTADQVRPVTKTQALDTFLAFHVDQAPLRITRQGAHTEWDSRAATFTVIPTFDYTGDRLGGINEKQQIKFDSYVNGETFNITLEDQTTGSTVYSNVAGTMIASLIAALEGLSNVGAGGVSIIALAADTYEVEFVGDNRGEDIAEMVPLSLSTAAGGVFAATLTQGVEGGEPVFSTTRGWPACGAFFKSRLWLGGLRSRPQTVLASKSGDFFNFDTKGARSNSAIDEDLDTDEATIIKAIFPGRHLQIFTSSAEFFVSASTITPPTPISRATSRGVQPSTPQGVMDTSTIFVTRGGDGLAQFTFDGQPDGTYTADYLNIMAPHLVKGVIDMAFRRARGPKETDLALLARDTGDATVMLALASQSVVGFSSWTTDGQFEAGMADLAGNVYVAVRRMVAGVPEIMLEKVDAAAMLDSQVAVTVEGAPLTQLLVPHLTGQTVTLYLDGSDAGDVVVNGAGFAIFPVPALRQAVVGCLFQPRFVSLPFATEEDPRPLADKAERIGSIAFLLGPTTNLKAGILGHRKWKVPLTRRADAHADAGDDVNAFTGWTKVADVPGFSELGQIEWVQERPGPLTVKQIVVTVDS